MTQTFVLLYKFPTLNDYTDTARGNKYASAADKRMLTDLVTWEAKSQHLKPAKKARIGFLWRETNRMRDPDNIAFAKKYILDGLVKAGVLQGDGWKHVTGFTDDFELGDENEVTVTITEI